MKDQLRFLNRKKQLLAFLAILLALVVIVVFISKGFTLYRYAYKPLLKDSVTVQRYIDTGRLFMVRKGGSAMDSAGIYANKAKKLSESIDYFRGIGDSYFLKADIASAKGDKNEQKKNLNAAIGIYKQYVFFDRLGPAYRSLSDQVPLSDTTIKEKIAALENAQQYFELAGQDLESAHALKDLGDISLMDGSFLKGHRILMRSLETYRKVKHPNLFGIYDLINVSYVKRGNYDSALYYGRQSIANAKDVHLTDTNYLSTIYNHLGEAYFYNEDLKNAVKCFEQSLYFAQVAKNETSISHLVRNLAFTLLRDGKPDAGIAVLTKYQSLHPDMEKAEVNELNTYFLGAYVCKKDKKMATVYYNKVKDIVENLSNEDDESDVFIEMALYHITFKNYKEAERTIDRGMKFYVKNNVKNSIVDIQRLRFESDSTQNNLAAALSSFMKYKQLSDSFYLIAKRAQANALQRQFQNELDIQQELKDQNIRLLKSEGKLQEVKLQQTKTTSYFLFAGTMFLIILLAIGYRTYYLKQKNNRLLQLQKDEIDRQNISLKHSIEQQIKLIKEKEWLVKEVHHRVKNNLQIIVSLLNFQAKYLDNDAAKNAIKNSQDRIRTMSLIHQRLYLGENLKYINIQGYVRELILDLKKALSYRNPIEFEVNIEEIELEVLQVVPVGLILNEAITNAVKYAFENRPGRITIQLFHQEEGRLSLTIKDNGIGLPQNFDWRKSSSLGFNLIQTMAQQLQAEMEVVSNGGLTMHFYFYIEHPEEPEENSVS